MGMPDRLLEVSQEHLVVPPQEQTWATTLATDLTTSFTDSVEDGTDQITTVITIMVAMVMATMDMAGREENNCSHQTHPDPNFIHGFGTIALPPEGWIGIPRVYEDRKHIPWGLRMEGVWRQLLLPPNFDGVRKSNPSLQNCGFRISQQLGGRLKADEAGSGLGNS